LSSHTKPGPGRGRRWLNRRAALAAVAGVAATGIAGAAIVADAAVPSFPNNIVVFPDRDFVTIEGYQTHIGETGLVEVRRDGQLIGSAQGVVEEGDVAFEVNHPGGYCWGNDTDLKVTPDIRPGDKVSLSFDGVDAGDTTVANAYVTGDAVLSAPPGSPAGTPKNTLTVTGFVGPGVTPAQMEQRIINPDLTDTDVGRRDIRAVPGDLTPAAKGGYSSALSFDGTKFTATYVFDDPATAQIASEAELGERAMSWQEEDADGNRQGLTIAEFGELGGPGMGGCPAGPGDAGAPKPGSANVARSVDKTSIAVTWKGTAQVPGAAAVTGYSVEAIRQSPVNGENEVIGKRVGPDAEQVSLNGLSASQGYDVEVRSIAAGKMSDAYTVQTSAASNPGDTTVPAALTASPAKTGDVTTASEVTLKSEPGTEIYYTTDGSPAIDGGLPADNATFYNGPIIISAQVTIHAVAFDRAGNFTEFTGTFKPPVDTSPAPSAVTTIVGAAGQESVKLDWAAPDGNPTSYTVKTYLRNIAADGAISYSAAPESGPKDTSARTLTVTGLKPGTDYWFTVTAKNASGSSPESNKVGGFTPTKVTDTVTIATAKWKSGDFRVTGSGSFAGANLEIRNAGASGPGTTVLGQGRMDAAVPPAGPTYDIRVRGTSAPGGNPGKIYVVSSGGGVAGPFTVANG
jgi:hypothetical protein